ncbi:alkaline phosphatase [uncultured Lutibacter sp.]|uniref:alkaline phosphatase n=1 Tax=uncultured Lutibacter sp. TaxID=437739 RepID=UPI0026179C43|nr:alkaline phosphatase [uncultured Lutibacter sp.]
MKLIKTILILVFFVLFSCVEKVEVQKKTNPKNVILLIADGTGLAQVSTAFYFKETSPNYGRFKNIGLINTSSASDSITDSAAGATAFSSGEKTYNGAIGVNTDSVAIENIVEVISLKNIKTGLIATSSITHATPAAFYAHSLSRNLAEDIALDLVASDVDFFAAGGLKYFNKRKDQRNLLKELESKEFVMDTIALDSFNNINDAQKVGFLLAQDGMPKMTENRGDFLENATDLGIKFLSKNNSNFFMMVEGSQIDWGGHSNDGNYVVTELLDFDDAVGKALDFAEKDGNTLVVVTGDHETGGLSLSSNQKVNQHGTEYSDYNDVNLTFSTHGHSTTLIPVFAFGPGSEEFQGIYQNNDIYKKIMKITGWK